MEPAKNTTYLFSPQLLWGGFLFYIILILPLSAVSQEKQENIPDGTEGETLIVLDSSSTKKKPWYMVDTRISTFKFGMGVLLEYAAYNPNESMETQLDLLNGELKPTFDVRDFRFLVSGQLKTKRTISWKAAFMYDGSQDKPWFVRETGVMIATPEIWGHIFLGRTKEGISLSKVMNGFSLPIMERQMAIDHVPILADGIKWLGYLPKPGIVWNIGIYTDWVSKGQSFSTYKWQFASRVAWLPIHSNEKNTTLHIGGNFRIGQPVDNLIRLKSRPESNPAPIVIDTGTFSSNQSTIFGGEIYYSTGSWMFGSEYYWHSFNSTTTNNPVFNGGELLATYIFTGAKRPYNTVGGIYTFIPIEKSVFKGGLGEIEGVIRFSSLDLNGGSISGGKYWRITPMVNWYLSDNLRFELAYGYGILNRYDLEGATHFFQTRLQFMF